MISVYLLFGLDSRRSDKNGTPTGVYSFGSSFFLSAPVRSVIISGGAVLCGKRR